MTQRKWVALAWLLVAACQDQPPQDEAAAAHPRAGAEKAAAPVTPAEPEQAVNKLSVADTSRVCRAAIADLNGHQPSLMKGVREDRDGVRIRYARPSDGKVWTNDCRLVGDRVMWRTVDAFGPGSGEGRWRSDPADEGVTFSVAGDEITITTAFPGEAPGSETYRVAG